MNNKSNIIHSDQLFIGYNINDDIIEYIDSQFNKIIIFTQEKIKKSFNHRLQKLIVKYKAEVFILDDGEKAKSISGAIKSINYLSEIKADKNSLLIAYGGGTVTDHVGFVSSIFKRGVEYINIPTTLIGMIDASIGGKTAINLDEVKNQIGTFYHPSKIFIELNFIDSMPLEIIQEGLGEMFKYSILQGENIFNDFKDYLQSNNSKLLHNLIYDCCRFKLKIIEIDERDQNIRKTLNLGHTFGHAIESDSKNKISHGISVANGIFMAALLSFKNNYLNKSDFKQICLIADSLIIKKYKINDVDKFVDYMLSDKKNNHDKIGIIAIKAIGKVDLKYFQSEEIQLFIGSYNEHISN